MRKDAGYDAGWRVTAPLATANPRGRPVVTRPDWPIKIKDAAVGDVPDALFMASVARREEKGSDVNVAAHLLLDVLQGAVDAAVLISNDSDLALPIREVRERVPVGTVNPTRSFLAGDLRGAHSDGVGGHWWYQLDASDLTSCQLPVGVGRLQIRGAGFPTPASFEGPGFPLPPRPRGLASTEEPESAESPQDFPRLPF